MCFSASASFAAAALLVPVGVAAVRSARARPAIAGGTSALPLAMCPLLFGLQQACEGVVWLGVAGRVDPGLQQAAAILYLFFAYGFWLAWIPFAALRFGGEVLDPPRRAALVLLLTGGLAFGALLWLPLLADPAAVVPEVVHGSLRYPTPQLFAGRGLAPLGEAFFGVGIVLPLLLTASWGLVVFALGLLAAFAVSEALFRHAFSSVWCYSSAWLSLLLLWIVAREPAPGDVVPRKPAPLEAPGA